LSLPDLIDADDRPLAQRQRRIEPWIYVF